ncbi:MAG: MgtC/SapB family protein [Candidatus Gracilibacteria bacterium]|jgi:uncharacterized membrane protein (DUF4010 family)
MDYSIFQQLGSAAILASLVGMEREHKYQVHHHDIGFAGLRTFTLIGVLGALSYIISRYMSNDWVFIVMTLGFMALIVLAYFISSKSSNGWGITSEIAAVLVYVVGVLCAMEQYVLATVISLAVFFILHFKTPLHNWAKKIRDEEFLSTAEFIVIAFVILPLLPNKAYGPYEFFNPYIVWLIVVFISGISFVSYVAIKLLGARKGIGLTGFLGGLVSSTALSLSFSAQSKKNTHIVKSYVFAMVVASSAVFFKALIEVAVLNPGLLGSLTIPMLTMGITGLISAAFLWVKKDDKEASKAVDRDMIKMKSPFSLSPALKFGILFAVILFMSKFAVEMMGNKGLYLSSVFSAFLDADAVFVSVANLAKTEITQFSAVVAITIAAVTNTIVKGVIFFVFGNRKVAFRLFSVYLLMFVAGAISFLFV